MSFVCDAMQYSGLSCIKGIYICISQREVISDLNKDLEKNIYIYKDVSKVQILESEYKLIHFRVPAFLQSIST